MPKQREKMTEVHSCGSPPFSTCLGAVASFIISQGQRGDTMNLYIDYSEFELTCWNTDGKGTNVAIPLTEEQAKKICDIIGLLGFAEENGKIVGYHRAKEND